MKLEDALKLPAGRELDQVVAEEVMDWRWAAKGSYDDTRKWILVDPAEAETFLEGYIRRRVPEREWYAYRGYLQNFPAYSESIEAAWQVVEKLWGEGLPMVLYSPNATTDEGLPATDGDWVVWFGLPSNDIYGHGKGETAMLALCRGAIDARLNAA